MIYLYESTITDFIYNGQPFPKAYEVIVDRTINDEFFVTGKHPLDENNRYKLIQKDKIIKAHTPDGMQPFRIMDVNKRLGYIEFEAWPLLYADLRNKLIKPFKVTNSSGQSVLNTFINNLLLGTNFSFTSNILSTHDFSVRDETEAQEDPNQLYDALEVFKSIVNRWSGELIINGYDIRLVSRLGKDTDALLYEKKNITDFVDKESIQGIVTRVHGKSEWTEDGPGGKQVTKRIKTTVDSPLINAYSGIVFEQQFTNNDVRTEQELKNWLTLKFSTENIDKSSRTIELDTNIVDETEVALGDKLNLKYLKHDVDMLIRMTKYQYDGFNNKYIKIFVGDALEHFTGSVQNTISIVETNIKNSVDKTIAHVIVNQLGQKIIYSEYEPEGDYSEGDIWFDNKGGMYFWDEASANWIPHPFNNRVDIVEQEVKQHTDEIATVTQSANDAVAKADQLIIDAGFIKLDVIQVKSDALNTASTAQSAYNNAISASSKADTAISTTENFSLLVNDLEQSVTFKADSSRVDTISGKVDSQSLLIKANTDALIYKADKTSVDTINQTVNQHTNDISINAQAIDARLTSTQVDNLVSAKNYVNQTQLQTTANGIQLDITKVSTNLSNLEIGGRNLLLNTVKISSSTTGSNISTDVMAYTPNFMITGKEYTLSFDLKADTKTSSPNIFINGGLNITKTFNFETEWTRQYITFIYNGQTYSTRQIYPHFYPTGTMVKYTKNFKLESGNKDSDWSPAPEDMATLEQYTTLDVKVNGIQTTVGNKADKTEVTQLANQWTQTTNLANGHTGQIANLGNDINLRVTSGQVTEAILADKRVKDTRGVSQSPAWYFAMYAMQSVTEFKERTVMGAPGSAYWTQVTTKVAWYDYGGGPIIQTLESSDGTFTRVSNSDFSGWNPWDKVIEAGKLISQINIQSNNILIQSGKLYLDAASVVFSGSAFIPSAAITTLTVDKLNGGTANFANFNVINFNAANITSGTVSGANSAWNLNTGVQTYTNPSSGDVLTLTQGQILFTNGAQSRYLNYNAEGLQLVPGSGNTGTSKNTSLHLIGGGTGSYQYIQFASGSGITQRLEVEGQYMTAYHGSGGAFQVAKYGENPNSGVVISGAYETRHSTGVSLRIAGDSISTPRDGARNIFLTPQGVGSVISGNSSGVRYNMVASDFVKQSSRTTKKIIGPITEGLTVINRLTAITYYKLSKLNDGIVEIEKGFISEDSPDVATPDRKGIYDSHITAHLVKGMQELDQKVIAINSLATAANSIANNAMNKVFQIDNDVQNTKNKIVAIDSLVTAANSIATKAMNKAIQTDGEFQQMKNKILELEQEIKTLKGAA